MLQSTKQSSQPRLKNSRSMALPMNTILEILFSPSSQGAASSSSLTSITAWNTCLKGCPLTAMMAFILKIVPLSGGSWPNVCMNDDNFRGTISPSVTKAKEFTRVSCLLSPCAWPCPWPCPALAWPTCPPCPWSSPQCASSQWPSPRPFPPWPSAWPWPPACAASYSLTKSASFSMSSLTKLHMSCARRLHNSSMRTLLLMAPKTLANLLIDRMRSLTTIACSGLTRSNLFKMILSANAICW
mmetsp:Transcript_6790/g.13709  ORF Transcript_6790/g.13709 Transcript_6790/m.13709 type:complete len:242 (+) Transcript_6790:388-1113(+)